MRRLFQMICVVLTLCFAAKAQNCKVLLPAIATSYEGDCKNGKANGMGKATGTDKYEGNFKNGYPEGQGKYTWSNGNWYEGNFKSGLRSGEGTVYYASSGKSDSSVAGFWAKDMYIGIYEAPYKVISKSYMVNTVTVAADAKEDPTQIVINLSSVKGGSEDLHGNIPKPELTSIEVKKGSFLNRKEVTSMNKKNTYYLIDIIYPFSALFRFGEEEVLIDFNNDGCWKVDVVLR